MVKRLLGKVIAVIDKTPTIIQRICLFLASILICVSGSPVVAMSSSQRKIINMSIPYYNECMTGNSGAIVAGDNKDYAGNPVFTEEQLKNIQELSPFYVAAAEKYNIPWQVLAVIHIRESGQLRDGPANGQGPFQDYNDGKPIWPVGPYDDAMFQKAADKAAWEYVEKSKEGGYDPNSSDGMKFAFFGYNGRSDGYKRQARNLGFTAEQAEIGEGSPYVMNKADAKRDPNTAAPGTWGQVKVDNGPIEYPANQDHGAYVMYLALGGPVDGSAGGSASTRDDGKFIWVGDSRTEGMSQAINKDENEWVAKASTGYDWFNSEAAAKVTKALGNKDQAEDTTIVFNFGVNDLDNADKYKTKLNELAKGDWKNAKKIIVMSVNPVDDTKAKAGGSSATNSAIEEFNKKIKNGLDSKIEYKDIYSQIKDKIKTDDGIHYDNSTYEEIYDLIRGTESDDAVCDSSGSTLTGTSNEKIAQLAKEWGEWGAKYSACYVLAGGHSDQAWMDKAIESHFTGQYGVDCSGFVSAVIYKASGKFNVWDTVSMCNDTQNFKEVTDPQPGDIAIKCDKHVEIITEVNSDGSFNTVGSHSSGCGEGKGASPSNYKGEKVLRYIGEGASNS
ncbi:MAG: hypothetical protein Q4C83_00100 [Candidatus Saccharibacteria bacterium]|nr:hypothetical protein [Candidatus Saccharibacteria bacterium]